MVEMAAEYLGRLVIAQIKAGRLIVKAEEVLDSAGDNVDVPLYFLERAAEEMEDVSSTLDALMLDLVEATK